MERLHKLTSQTPETPHEAWFQDQYGKMITDALERLKNPPNPSHPSSSWYLFKQVNNLCLSVYLSVSLSLSLSLSLYL